MEGIPEKLLLCCQRFLLPSVGSSDPDLSCSFPPGLAGQAVAAALAPPSGGRGERGRPVTSEGGGALLGGSPWTRSGVACPLRSVCFVCIQASKQKRPASSSNVSFLCCVPSVLFPGRFDIYI